MTPATTETFEFNAVHAAPLAPDSVAAPLPGSPERSAEAAHLAKLLEQAREAAVAAPQRALELCDAAEALALRLDERNIYLHARATRAHALISLSEMQAAAAMVNATWADVAPDDVGLRLRLAALDGILLQRAGQIGDALGAVMSELRVLDPATAQQHPAAASTLYNLTGSLMNQLSDYAGAVEYCTLALPLMESLGRRDSVAAIHNNLGMVHRELAELEQAVECFEVALNWLRPDDQNYLRAMIQGNLGLVLLENGMADDAFAPLRSALALTQRLESVRGQGAIHHNLGRAYHQTGDLARADQHFRQAMDWQSQGSELLDLAETRIHHAALLHDLGRDAEATALLAEVLAGPTAAIWPRLRSDAWHLKFRIHEAAGEFQLALASHVAFHDARRALVDDHARLRHQALLIRFRTDEAHREREQERARSQEFERLALTDGLTGVPNRRHLDQHLAGLMAAGRVNGSVFAIALIDVDHFKRINDALSHAVGDLVLRQVAATLQSRLRSGDLLARYGGEEFVVVFRGATLDAAIGACERLRAGLTERDWSGIAPNLRVTASLGVAQWTAAEPASELLKRADAALYRAKQAGRNRVESGVSASS